MKKVNQKSKREIFFEIVFSTFYNFFWRVETVE